MLDELDQQINDFFADLNKDKIRRKTGAWRDIERRKEQKELEREQNYLLEDFEE